MLFLFMATCHFAIFGNCLTVTAFKTSKNTVCEHFLSNSKCSKMSSTSLHVFSYPLSKTQDNCLLWKFFPCFLHSRVCLALYEGFKKALCITVHT